MDLFIVLAEGYVRSSSSQRYSLFCDRHLAVLPKSYTSTLPPATATESSMGAALASQVGSMGAWPLSPVQISALRAPMICTSQC